MAYFPSNQIVITLAIIVLVFLSSTSAHELSPTFYSETCPNVLETVRNVVQDAIKNERRMGASLLRLHFHDCFVQGCDASILLDDTSSFEGEKNAISNKNSTRGFEVVDKIKEEVEKACPGVVSCADILAIAARDSVQLLGGPTWKVNLGRSDSKTASVSAANDGIPNDAWTLNASISRFKALGLSTKDHVALSGAHGLRQQNQISFNKTNLDDVQTQQIMFSNSYFSTTTEQNNSVYRAKLLTMDRTKSFLIKYSKDSNAFNANFAAAMIKMGNIKPLTKSNGEIRKNCRRAN